MSRKLTKQRAAELVAEAWSQAVGDREIIDLRVQLEKGVKKGKCCQSRPRCKKCPTVVHRLRKSGALALDDKALHTALIKARKW